jgi:outer membrane protein
MEVVVRKSMRNAFVLALVGLLTMGLWGSAFAQLKIGYIDSQKILTNYKESIDAQKKLDAQNQKWQQEMQQMQKQLKDLQDQLDAQKLLLSDAKKQEKQQEIQDLYLKIQQFQMKKWGQQGELFQMQQKLMAPIIDQINKTITKIGQEEKFDYIFDTVQGNIVYASKKQPDLTDKVLEALNKSAASTTKK